MKTLVQISQESPRVTDDNTSLWSCAVKLSPSTQSRLCEHSVRKLSANQRMLPYQTASQPSLQGKINYVPLFSSLIWHIPNAVSPPSTPPTSTLPQIHSFILLLKGLPGISAKHSVTRHNKTRHWHSYKAGFLNISSVWHVIIES